MAPMSRRLIPRTVSGQAQLAPVQSAGVMIGFGSVRMAVLAVADAEPGRQNPEAAKRII